MASFKTSFAQFVTILFLSLNLAACGGESVCVGELMSRVAEVRIEDCGACSCSVVPDLSAGDGAGE